MRSASKVITALLLLLLGLLALTLVSSVWFLSSLRCATAAEGSESVNLADTTKLNSNYDKRQKEVLLANADRKIRERRAWLSPRHSEGAHFGALKSDQFFYMFTPVMPCFWTFEKEPTSIVQHDGPKWLCGLQEVHQMRSTAGPVASSPRKTRKQVTTNKRGEANNNNNISMQKHKVHYVHAPCIVYSMGSGQRFSFEERVRTIAPGCEIHTFDPTSQETGVGKEFYDVYHGDYGFGGKDSTDGRFPVKSLATIMKELGHSHVDYLKVDVEGYEWDFLSLVDWNASKVGQILIELHPQKHWSGDEMTAKDMNVIFTKLETAGYRLISIEPVTFRNWGQVEVVFIRNDWEPSGNW
ncbi:methyltransferase domain-containing protein [Fragilaria crotonensis]|nr:methyltransferase domain-containing protein [Fragilaria crotonensis]